MPGWGFLFGVNLDIEDRQRQEKRDKVTRKSAKVSSTTVLIGILLVGMIGGGVALTIDRSPGSEIKLPKQVERVKVTGPVDYTEARVDMKKVDYETDGKWITLDLDDVIKNKLVTFNYKSPKINVETRNFAGKPELPMLAMVDPKGKLMVGVSYCEPCRSITFHTEKDMSLTCNICGTKWDIETLVAWSGACMPFPPDEVKVKVEDDKVFIPRDYLEKWEPRKET